MNIIKLNDKYFKSYISEEEIERAVQKLVSQISIDLMDETPLFIGILNGSFMFVADFVRKYKSDCEISFVKLSSYEGINSTGKIKQLVGLNSDIEGKVIVILEDIIDTGNTLQEIYNIFKDKKVKQLKVATLFFKPDVYKKELPIDYIGISIPDKFIVGYGLDYDGKGRNLENVYQLMTKSTMKNIVLLGPPGAGKGTQADLLKEKYNLKHISTGEVFRYNIKNKTKLGLLAKTFMDDGNLVPDDVTIEMLKDEVDKVKGVNGFIFDGFPRTIPQAKALDDFLETKGEIVNGMVALEVPDNLLIQRLLNRGKSSGRPDDQNEIKIRTRFEEYNNKTAILKEYYQTQNKYFGVNGVGDISDITSRLCEIIDEL